MHHDLLQRRADYPILQNKTYLINNSLGAMHAASRDRLSEYADLWASEGVVAWRTWLPEMVRVADLVGAIIGAPAGTTVMGQNVASLLGAVASALDFTGSRNRVVCTELDWPGSHYLWTEHARFGVQTAVVPSSDGMTIDAARVVEEIDERTAVVSISHVLFKSAYIVDIAPIVERAHQVGALVLLDAYQSAGAVPVDVVAADVDLCVGGSVKYLCGGPGNGWLYIKPTLVQSLRPAQVGWFGHARPFGFEFDAIDYADGVARFAGGTPGVPAAYAAAPGYQAILDVGIDRIRERSLSMTQPMLEDALERGFVVRSPQDAAVRGGHVTIDPGDAEHVHDELIRRGFVVDYRPGAGLRVAPHFYNSAEECTAILDEMSAIRAGH
ncbi:MAG TPA: aminotransferase class V-fold PLP-dependent enzyme [Mycobacteriales bacterium]|nr:aminotransferase class V-fold PLP-dependent enzyme [Mycobacteriales bacterium]